MTRCVSCDKNLNNFESTRKIISSDNKVEYPDLCNKCFKDSGLGEIFQVIERTDFPHDVDIDCDSDENEKY